MRFYFVRHGQTELNRQHLLGGSGLDHPLNPEGHEQARRLARAIRQTIGEPIQRIVASDLKRARQTAEYLSQELGVKLETNPALREWHLGEWEGKTFEEFGHLILGDGEPTQGEKRHVFYSRIENAWKDLHSDERPYLIVSHGAVWLALQDVLKIPRFKVNNCDLVKVYFEAEQWKAEILALR